MVSAAKRSVSISVECGDITRFAADVIALKYARGLFGAAQGVASALGKTEAEIQQQLPDLGSAQLYPGGGRLQAAQALFVRTVQLFAFDSIEIRQFSTDVLRTLSSLAPRTRHLAMTPQGIGLGLSPVKSLHAQVSGCADALEAGSYPGALARISLVERDASMAETLQSALRELLPEGHLEAAPAPEPARTPTTLPKESEAYDVFISYKNEDGAHAQQVYEYLKAQGVRPFFSRETLPVLGSDEYHEQIDAAIERARHMVVVTSSGEHATAKWVRYEWRLFLGEKLAGRKAGNLVTVIAGGMGIEELPIGLRHREVVQLTPADLGRLLEYVKDSST